MSTFERYLVGAIVAFCLGRMLFLEERQAKAVEDIQTHSRIEAALLQSIEDTLSAMHAGQVDGTMRPRP